LISKILKQKKQLVTYFIVGVVTNVLNYLVYLAVLLSFSAPIIAGICGFSAGLVTNFFLNKKYTFNSIATFKSRFLSYLIVQLIVLFVQLFSLKLFIVLLFDERIAQIPAILISGILNYILLKIYIFKK